MGSLSTGKRASMRLGASIMWPLNSNTFRGGAPAWCPEIIRSIMFQFAVRVRDLPVAAGATCTRRLRQQAIAEQPRFYASRPSSSNRPGAADQQVNHGVVAAPFYAFSSCSRGHECTNAQAPKRRDLLVKSLGELFHTRIGTALDN